MSPGPDDREGGFIAVHRRIESWPLYASLRAEHRHVITTLLLAANWKPGSFWYGKTQVFVGRGELAVAEETLAKRAGTTRKVVRTTLAKLEAEGFLSRKKVHESGQCPNVLTIKNYDDYQRVDEKGAREGPERGPDRTSRTNNTTTPTPDGVAPVLTLVSPGEGKPKPVRKARKQAPELEAAKARLDAAYVAKFPGASLPWTGSCWGYLAKMLKAGTEDGLAASWAAFLASKFYPEKSFFIFATRAYANVRFSAEAAAPKPQPRRIEEFS